MEIELSKFKLYTPDEMISYWFISHDFAGELGLEFSQDAARQLRAILPPQAKIDYEADAVNIRISKKENVLPALSVLYKELSIPDEELLKITNIVSNFKRPRPKKIAEGDIFIIPVKESLFALGQILQKTYSCPTVAIFPEITTKDKIQINNAYKKRPIAILHIGGDSLYRGQWPIIESQPVIQDPNKGSGGQNGSVGSISYGGDGPIVDLLKAIAGITSWDIYPLNPDYLKKLLI